MKTIPVTRSILSEFALGEFFKSKYQLDDYLICVLFRTGINHTYFLKAEQVAYVIRVYSHNWRSRTEIKEELKLLNVLHENGLNVSYAIRDQQGKLIQELAAPEGVRYAALFTYAKGGKVRFMDEKMCFQIGTLMANFHQVSGQVSLKRVIYNEESLLQQPYEHLKQFFSEELEEMQYIKALYESFDSADFAKLNSGAVHMDIWYDNMAISANGKATIFDFDFCGTG